MCFPFKILVYQRGDDIRLAEIRALEEERLTGRFGQRVGETIADIEGGAVPALPKAAERFTCDLRLFLRGGHNFHRCHCEKRIQPCTSRYAFSAFDDEGQFDPCHR